MVRLAPLHPCDHLHLPPPPPTERHFHLTRGDGAVGAAHAHGALPHPLRRPLAGAHLLDGALRDAHNQLGLLSRLVARSALSRGALSRSALLGGTICRRRLAALAGGLLRRGGGTGGGSCLLCSVGTHSVGHTVVAECGCAAVQALDCGGG